MPCRTCAERSATPVDRGLTGGIRWVSATGPTIGLDLKGILMTDPTHVTGSARVKRGMAEMLKGGVIMDVVTAEQAKIAEDAGAVAVMALASPCRYPCPRRRCAHE